MTSQQSAPKGPFPLKVAAVREAGERAKTLVFECPEALRETFAYRAGQFLTLHPTIDGKQVQRAYSLCGAPAAAAPPTITVQRVENGLVSNFLHDQVAVGDTVPVSPPRGKFCADIAAGNHRSYYAFAAGSGITPIFSQIQQILLTEATSCIFLLYGCRDENNIIFREELEALAQQHPTRFHLDIILSRPRSHQWRALFSSQPRWTGDTGRIDETRVKAWIVAHPPPNQTVCYLVCGPNAMIETVTTALTGLDVDRRDILSERFGAAASKETASGNAASLTATLNGQTNTIAVDKGQTLLQAMVAADLNPPFSCQAGVCGSCRATCKKGRVSQTGAAALSEQERKDGAILTCRAQALEEHITIKF